jgi:translation initiation factor IF-1
LGTSLTEWYRGTIAAAVPNTGLYDIRYTDGEEESDVKRRCIRRFTNYAVGEEVEARPLEEPTFFRGRVVRLLPNERYDVEIGGGTVLKSVLPQHIRRFESISSGSHGSIGVGSRVMANFEGAGTYYPGIIVQVNDDNTFDVEYDDGDTEVSLDIKFVRPV